MKKLLFCVAVIVLVSGCTHVRKENPKAIALLDECTTQRRLSSAFNARKSYALVRYECSQLLLRDNRYLKAKNYASVPRWQIRFEDQMHFDDELWFMITEEIRKKHYPDYLPPEQEVQRAAALMEYQRLHIRDESIHRAWEPRLVPPSPYLMNGKQLDWVDSVELPEQYRKTKEFTELYWVKQDAQLRASERIWHDINY